MDNIGVNYRPIKSLEEFLKYANSSDSHLNTYNYEFRHLLPSFVTQAYTWRSFVIHVEDLRNLKGEIFKNCLKQVPGFTFSIPSVNLSGTVKDSNATAVLEFLISKGGVFVMLPPQERVKEVPNE